MRAHGELVRAGAHTSFEVDHLVVGEAREVVVSVVEWALL